MIKKIYVLILLVFIIICLWNNLMYLQENYDIVCSKGTSSSSSIDYSQYHPNNDSTTQASKHQDYTFLVNNTHVRVFAK